MKGNYSVTFLYIHQPFLDRAFNCQRTLLIDLWPQTYLLQARYFCWKHRTVIIIIIKYLAQPIISLHSVIWYKIALDSVILIKKDKNQWFSLSYAKKIPSLQKSNIQCEKITEFVYEVVVFVKVMVLSCKSLV